jgi:hypothetical protein
MIDVDEEIICMCEVLELFIEAEGIGEGFERSKGEVPEDAD